MTYIKFPNATHIYRNKNSREDEIDSKYHQTDNTNKAWDEKLAEDKISSMYYKYYF